MDIKQIFKTIYKVSKKNNIPVYVVGGYVRDLLMGIGQKQDLDFVVVGSGLGFAKLLDEHMKEEGSLIEFPDFDTARYVLGEGEKQTVIEFAGARSEKYFERSRKPVVETTTLEEDLSRRDFTVNAMALPVACFAGLISPGARKINSQIVDPFNGREDIKNKILRTPLDPDKTFSDDPLRMLRAIRFASQLNFSIEPKTLESIFKNKDRLKIISAERIREELMKLLATEIPSVGLSLLFQTYLLDLILPEVAKLDGVEEVFGHQHKNNLVHTFKVVDNIAERHGSVLLRFAGLLHDIGKFSTKKFIPKIGWTFYQHEHLGKKMVYIIARRLRLSKNETDYLAKLVRWHQQPISLMDEGITDSAVRRLIVNLGDDLEDLLILGVSDITTGNPNKLKKRQENYTRLRKRITEVFEKDKLREFQSPVRGDEIMAECGLKAGPTVGKIKDAIENAILDGIIPNEYDVAKEYFLKIREDYLRDALDWER
ncbi:CCA tRNA nucleotidyltransferase, partial [Patescibacteria group bacterium]|nr:CCA tRNA nucleotidyltransferase [Patescibacteria group bacterium]